MQFLQFLVAASISLSGVLASPHPISTPASPSSCYTTWYPSTICETSPPTAVPTAPVSIINQQNICHSGSPYCCALASSNNINDGGHSCNSMENSTINCDSTVICCNDNGSGTQICTNSLTIVIPLDLSNVLGDVSTMTY